MVTDSLRRRLEETRGRLACLACLGPCLGESTAFVFAPGLPLPAEARSSPEAPACSSPFEASSFTGRIVQIDRPAPRSARTPRAVSTRSCRDDPGGRATDRGRRRREDGPRWSLPPEARPWGEGCQRGDRHPARPACLLGRPPVPRSCSTRARRACVWAQAAAGP